MSLRQLMASIGVVACLSFPASTSAQEAPATRPEPAVSPSKTIAADSHGAMTPQQAAAVGATIRSQIQPCADHQARPGPGAERIVVTLTLHLNRDGSFAGLPTVVGSPSGVDDQNRQYVGRVVDDAITSFKGCSPLRGLPPELYDVRNGWSSFSIRYKLPG